MSYDQKPSRIKLVSTGWVARARETKDEIAAQAETEQPVEGAEPVAQTSGGLSLVSAVLFLCGCAIGGAGLAAWPHLAG
ncbi:hypothetical protein [Alteriqipengyuania sp. 357]